MSKSLSIVIALAANNKRHLNQGRAVAPVHSGSLHAVTIGSIGPTIPDRRPIWRIFGTTNKDLL